MILNSIFWHCIVVTTEAETHPKDVRDDTKELVLKHQELQRTYRKLVEYLMHM